ncbi:MAG: DUF3307 domain-containing protein [Melioribacteraceae bacterium]|nr:DUF3307 domain-containing protein [Melioribacteraceae bacterium]
MVTNQVYLLITLVTAHIIGDFLLQTKNDVKKKNNNWIFTKHILIITFLSYIFIGNWSNWLIPIVIGVTHAFIDQVKLKIKPGKLNPTLSFIIDQTAHLLVIAIVALVFGSKETAQSFWLNKLGSFYLEINIYASGIILTVLTGGIVIGMMVKPFIDQLGDKQNGLRNGGELIGRLERLLIFFFVVIGNMTVVGFLIAAKSIFRFGELNDSNNRMQAEYILIGTLYSFSWAFIFAWLTQKLVELI